MNNLVDRPYLDDKLDREHTEFEQSFAYGAV